MKKSVYLVYLAVVLLLMLTACTTIPFLNQPPQSGEANINQPSSQDGVTATGAPGEAELPPPDPTTCEGKLSILGKDLDASIIRYDELESEIHKSLLELKQIQGSGDQAAINAKQQAILDIKEERQKLQGKVESLKKIIAKLPCYDAAADDTE